MSPITSCVVFAVCALIWLDSDKGYCLFQDSTVHVKGVAGASQPVEKLPVLKPSPSEVVFTDNKKLVLECVTEGKEDIVKYKWIKDNKPYTPSSDVVQRSNEGTLVFKHPSQKDEGQYQCLAESSLGIASSNAINVKRSYIEIPKVTVQKHKPEEGKTFKLDCKIPKSYPKPEISWFVESAGSKAPVQGQRFTISDQGDLYFSNVTKEDTEDKKYTCVAKSVATDDEVILAKHVLEDVTPSKGGDNEVVQQYVTKDITLKAGESVYLYCIYGGNPLAHPDWFKDGVNVNNSPQDRVTRYNKSVGKRLLIKQVLPEDEGEYTCTVDNEVGKPQKYSFKVKVIGVPQFVVQPEQKVIAKQGSDVTIPCKIRGIPEPKLTWTYNHENLPQSGKAKAQLTTKDNIATSELVIKNVQKGDGGYYGCKGANELGDVYAETLVYVQ